MSTSQNLLVRRAYLICPRQELIDHFKEIGEFELVEMFDEPNVVMTKALPYEGKLEGFRSLILKKCKEAFIKDLLEFEPFLDTIRCETLLGSEKSLSAIFDKWWTTVEVNTLEIEASW